MLLEMLPFCGRAALSRNGTTARGCGCHLLELTTYRQKPETLFSLAPAAALDPQQQKAHIHASAATLRREGLAQPFRLRCDRPGLQLYPKPAIPFTVSLRARHCGSGFRCQVPLRPRAKSPPPCHQTCDPGA
jgi:hypothetical protein